MSFDNKEQIATFIEGAASVLNLSGDRYLTTLRVKRGTFADDAAKLAADGRRVMRDFVEAYSHVTRELPER